jgi:hypothetical protein
MSTEPPARTPARTAVRAPDRVRLDLTVGLAAAVAEKG